MTQQDVYLVEVLKIIILDYYKTLVFTRVFFIYNTINMEYGTNIVN